MLYVWIAVCIATGVGAVFLAVSAPNRKRFCRVGYGFLTISATGLIGLCTGTVLFFLNHTSKNDGETLLRMFFSTTFAATAVCIVIILGAIFTEKKLLRPVVISVPFLWMIPLLLWTDLCASWTDKPGMILTLGLSLCALLLLCPAAAFLRAAALLKRKEAANFHRHKEDREKEKEKQ